uniref:ferroxidase n=1 Tax=Scleropages formosus TaxID=113540 RepID=A0A8C9V1W0_SCLFO
MRLCFWRVAPVLLGLLGSLLPVSQAVERHYFIAAVKIKWDYGSECVWTKKRHYCIPGLLGPTVRGEEGDVIVVTFRNMADREYSIHPHGIAYGKQSEGLYNDKDGKVLPEQEHTYYWEVTPEVAPKQSDPPCLTYSYLSHRDFIRDFNSGLIGTLMVCKKGSLNPAGEQIHFSKEYVLLFSVFDETKSWYLPKSTSSQNHVKYTINGYSNGTIPGNMCAYTSVSWHLLGMSSEPEIFSVHFNGQVLQNTGHRLSSVGLISGTATSINVTAVHPGCWLLSSHATKHLEAGMHGFLNIQTCVGITPPRRRITIQEKRQSQEWTYYIAAEEIIWDYAPNIPDYIDSEYQSKYLKQGRDRIGKKYKKAVFVEYVNETFTVKKENKQRKMETGILGPVIRAQIRDVVKVVFKNKASRPYSIYPHGLTIDKDAEGTYYPEGGNQTHAVQPGQTYTYVWKVIDEDEPTDRDSRCLTRMYHSAVDIPRDIASGLVGHLLICKSQSLNKRNVQLKADKEQQAMLAVFDENKSWYLDENIKTFCSDPSNVNKNSPDFYESNVMHSINGYVYDSGQNLMFCNGEIVTWHMSSVGAQDNIQTVTFYGHSFELNERVEDVLSLFPMTGETITMSMDNLGELAPLRQIMKHRICEIMILGIKFPAKMIKLIQKRTNTLKIRLTLFFLFLIMLFLNKDPEPITKMRPPVVDESTDYWASQLGLRSFRNQSNGPIDDVELLDFSLLDIDQNLPASNKTENLSLSFSTLGNNVTDPESSSSQTKTQLTLTEGVALEEPNVTVGSFNESRIESNTRRLNESEDHLWTQFANTLDKDSEVKRNGTEEDNSETTIFILLKNTTTEGSDLEERTKTIVPLAEPNLIIEEPKTTNPSETFKGSYILNTSTNSSEDIVTINNHAFTYIVGETHGTPSNTTVRVEDFLRTGSSGLMNLSSSDNYTDTHWNKQQAVEAHRSNISVAVPKTDVTEDEDVENSSKENMTSSSENGGDVMIYLQDNSKEAIFTSSLDRPRKHWSYDGKHKIVQLEMTENMTRYIKEDSNSTVNKKKTEQKPKSKMKYKRRRPMKMYAVKTRKKKVYKPQPRSELSPRGFMPPALNPRGARPIFSEEDLTEKPVVIGVPRQDFNDYDIYIPTLNDDLDHIDIPDEHKGNEYEYVNYKDPYGKQTDEKARYFSQVTGENVRTYFIAAVEMEWDYEGYGQRYFTKVIFRRYLDTTFTIPEIRGETDEHLGILGPIIKAEVDETIMVVFKNLAGRPYSLHAHGVSYSKQMEGLKYDDNSPHWYKLDNEVLPNESYTYIWKVEPKAGPKRHDSDCRMWPYYSGVNPEKDIHSGLVGPLLICREGTLNKELVDMREFILLFMSFDETKSWYYEKNLQRLEMKNKRAVVDPQLKDKLKFHAINGIIYSLKGLRMYTNQLVRWHVFNMGSSKDVQSIHFHGQTFVEKRENEYRQGVHLLLPGSFSTLEMWPSKPGLWLLESEVGEFQQKGMQTLFLIIDIDCAQPLGLISHSVKDSQITASHYTEWKPHLARLHNIGKYNAWSTDRSSGDWIQVDFQRPVVISKVATQGAKQFISSHYVLNYTVSYRTDGKNWITYKTFSGNKNSYEVKENTFFPPLIGRYVRLYPLHSYNRPTIRMEFYGCELDGCSVPLGMEQRTIKDSQITASSSASNWLHGLWHPWLARLNNQGAVNAWQAKYNDMQQWLQVELKDVKKITGIVTQGAKSMGKEMYVMSYIIQYSDDGKIWKTYNEDNEYGHPKVFVGNTDNNDHAKNYIYPPIFSKFIRIVPQRWERAITMRIELLGCDFE